MPQLGCKKPRQPRTHCWKGHAFSPENTGVQRKHGKRFCIKCAAARAITRREQQDPVVSRELQRIKMAAWRVDNVERERIRAVALRTSKKAWVDNFKSTAGCGLCPERHTACLEFHHRDPALKDANVSVALAHWSLERLQVEIAKCDVICSNCHRKLHWEERQNS